MHRVRRIKQCLENPSVSGLSRELSVVKHNCSEERDSRKPIKNGIVCHAIELQFYSVGVEGASEGDKHRKERENESENENESERGKEDDKTRGLENPTEKEMRRMNKLTVVHLYNKILLSNKKE